MVFLKTCRKDPTLVTLYGNVDIRQFDIGFQVPGQITKMYFEEGDTVQEGSLVAEIDAEDYKLQEAKSESEVAKAYAAMIQHSPSMINILFYTAQRDFQAGL